MNSYRRLNPHGYHRQTCTIASCYITQNCIIIWGEFTGKIFIADFEEVHVCDNIWGWLEELGTLRLGLWPRCTPPWTTMSSRHPITACWLCRNWQNMRIVCYPWTTRYDTVQCYPTLASTAMAPGPNFMKAAQQKILLSNFKCLAEFWWGPSWPSIQHMTFWLVTYIC